METAISAWITLLFSPCPRLEQFTQAGFQEYGPLQSSLTSPSNGYNNKVTNSGIKASGGTRRSHVSTGAVRENEESSGAFCFNRAVGRTRASAAKLRLPRVPGRPQEETGSGSPGTHRGKLPLMGFN